MPSARWTALVPLKARGARKTRLAALLSPAERERLSARMFQHVTSVLRSAPAIEDVVLLSEAPDFGWTGAWLADEGGGLNAELQRARRRLRAPRLLVIHADLPLLTVADLDELTARAESGVALAPDRRGTGTNALALDHGGDLPFAFGADSLRRHIAATRGPYRLVERTGLAFDVDLAEDLDLVTTLGWPWRPDGLQESGAGPAQTCSTGTSPR